MMVEVDHGAKILLVEDYDDARFMMRRLLEMSGYHVVEARDGEEAVERALESCPDLVLMDLGLPGMDGIAATRQIRQIKSLCGTYVVALTAFDSGDFRDMALAAGCNSYVVKPVDFELLERVIGDHLSRPSVPV